MAERQLWERVVAGHFILPKRSYWPDFFSRRVARLPLDLPASWDVTSDSIAAWVARRTGAGRLVLVKAVAIVDDYFQTAIEGARFDTAFITPEELPDSPLLPSPHG